MKNRLFGNIEKCWLRIPALWRISLAWLFWPGVVGVVIGALVLIQSFQMPGAALYVHNYTDRPISNYWVNDNWGGNAFAYGGGKATCCWNIVGQQLEVHWIKSVTRTQSQHGLKKEEFTRRFPNPPRKQTDTYLHVHFLPGDEVRLAWSDGVASPYREELKARFSKETP